MGIILPFVSCVVKRVVSDCGRLVDKSVIPKLLIQLLRGQVTVTLRVDPVDHDIVVGGNLIRRDAGHSNLQSPALTHATDALMLADERLESLHAIEKPELRHHRGLHARELHIAALPVFANRNDELAKSDGRVEAMVTLRSRFDLGRVAHGDHSTFRIVRCQARGRVVWVSCG